MNADEYFSIKKGDTVRINTELQFGRGWGNKPDVLPNGALVKVVDGLIGFRHYFLYVEHEGKTFKLQHQSMDKV